MDLVDMEQRERVMQAMAQRRLESEVSSWSIRGALKSYFPFPSFPAGPFYNG